MPACGLKHRKNQARRRKESRREWITSLATEDDALPMQRLRIAVNRTARRDQSGWKGKIKAWCSSFSKSRNSERFRCSARGAAGEHAPSKQRNHFGKSGAPSKNTRKRVGSPVGPSTGAAQAAILQGCDGEGAAKRSQRTSVGREGTHCRAIAERELTPGRHQSARRAGRRRLGKEGGEAAPGVHRARWRRARRRSWCHVRRERRRRAERIR